MPAVLKWSAGIAGSIVVLVLVAYLAGLRVFVIQPIGALPDGAVAVVYGMPGLNLIDSPDAFCMRKQGGVNLLCRAAIVGAVGKNTEILFKMPYSDFLYALTGAPEVAR